MQQTFLSLKKKTIDKLTLNQKRFVAEVIGTFIVVVLATGAVVFDAKFNGVLGIPFIAFLPFIGVAVGVYPFGKISMAHFNPAVTLGFLITKHITKLQLLYYFAAEILGALLGSLFVKLVIGREADLGANSPNYAYPLPTIFGVEVLASALLMAVIVILAFISGASMNPARSFGPAMISGALNNLWLYWSATFTGTSIVALLVRRKFASCQHQAS